MELIQRSFTNFIDCLKNAERRPNELLIALVSFTLLIIMGTLVAADELEQWEITAFNSINDLPDLLYPIIWPFMQYGVFVTIPFVSAIAFYYKKYRLATLLLIGGVGIYYLARIVKDELPRGRPGDLLPQIQTREKFAPGSKGFTSGHTAVAATIATFSHYYLNRKWQILSIVTLLVVVIGRVYVGAHLPLDVLGGVALGTGVASLINYIAGIPVPKKRREEDTIEWVRRHRPRHPGDIVRMFIAVVFFSVTTVLALTGSVSALEEAAFRVVNFLPSAISPVIELLMQFGALYFVFIATLVAAAFRHYRLSIKLLSGGVGVWVAAKIAKSLIDRERPFYILNEIIQRADNSGILGFPSGHASVAAFIATVAAPYVTKSWSRVFWSLAWITAIGRLFVGAHLPLDIIAGLSLGWFTGSLMNVAFGTPSKPWPRKEIARVLMDGDLESDDIAEASVDARGSVPIFAETKSGKKIFIKVIDNEHRNADILYRLWRFLTLREVQDEAPFASAKRLAEHEAYVSIQAAQVGVRTPKVLMATAATSNCSVIVTERINGKVLPDYKGDIDEPLINGIWNETIKLHDNRIAHRDLRAPNIMIDRRRQAWLIDFSFSQTAATDLQIKKDLVELLVSLSLLCDKEMVVRTAINKFGEDRIKDIQPYIQSTVLTRYTRSLVHKDPDIIDSLLAEIRKQTKTRALPKARINRLDVRWLMFLFVLGASIYYVIPRLGELGDSVSAFKTGDVRLLAGVLFASFLTYAMGAFVVVGAAKHRISYATTLMVQFATTMVNRVTIKGVGGAVMLEQYLERNGHKRAEATASVSLVYAAGVAVHVLMTILVILVVDPDLLTDFSDISEISLSTEQKLIGSVAILIALAGLMFIPRINRFLKKWTRETKSAFKEVVRSPAKSMQLFGGSAGVTLAYALAFSLSIDAFGPGLAFQEALLVYLAANVVAAAAPTPGGLGAAEAALSVGLTAFDVPIGQAVTSVLVFRLLTFWLPILPGIAAFRYLTKRRSI